MGTIYIFTFPNGKQYVGQSINLKQRYYSHKVSNFHLVDRAIQKYGWENILRDEIECPEEFLDEIETLWISNFDTLFPNGYNLDSGGSVDRHRSLKTKQKISKSNKGKLLGRKFSEDHKKRISDSLTGKKHPRINQNHIDKLTKACQKIVIQYSLNGEFIKEWESAIRVEREIGIRSSSISLACNKYGYHKTAGGFIWRHKNV